MLVCYDFSFFSHDAKVVEVSLCGNIFVAFLFIFSLYLYSKLKDLLMALGMAEPL